MKQLFFDLETTGLDNQKHAIHQLSGMVVIDGVIQEHFNFKIQPHKGALCSAEALQICGITMEILRSYPECTEQYKAFTTMLAKYVDKFNKKDKFYLCGFNNASFDNQFLRSFFQANGDNYFGSWFWSNCFDIMVMATPFLASQRGEMQDFKLKTVAKHCGIIIDETKLHEAQYDVDLTYLIYKKLSI